MIGHQDLTHLILTRFNTAVGFAPSGKGLNREWLESRLSLFEQYCLPSIAGQSNMNFTWLVFCDAASPEWFRAKMESYKTSLRPVYIDGSATDQVIAEAVRKSGLVSTPYLATTRLDNDDSLAIEYVAQVQKAFHHQSREFIEFPFGLQLVRGHLYNMFWPSNPFLTLIERVSQDGSFTTVLCVEHNKVRSAGKVRSIIRSPQWLQVIHGSNLLNTLGGWPKVSSRRSSNFRVNWGGDAASDSLLQRLAFSVSAFSQKGLKFLRKRAAPRRHA